MIFRNIKYKINPYEKVTPTLEIGRGSLLPIGDILSIIIIIIIIII
jgi:hypothetical protein